MSKSNNTAVIGGFVVGAIALGIIGVMVLGSGKFFSTRLNFVMFFEGSVKGLQTGSPVMFRGVKIGEVTDISLRLNTQDLSLQIPVYVEVDPGRFMNAGQQAVEPYRHYDALIKKGLRAQLASQSFVTGMLMVTLDFYSDEPAKFVGMDKSAHEIPTIPSDMEQLQKTLADLPFKEIVEKMDRVIGGIDSLVNSEELSGMVTSAKRMVDDMDALVRDVRAEMPTISKNVQDTAESARSVLAGAEKSVAEAVRQVERMAKDFAGISEAAQDALTQVKKTLEMKDGVPGQLAASLLDTLKSARASLGAGEKALTEVQGLVAGGSDVGNQLTQTLEEFRALSRALRALTEYLERHPESLIRGKEGN